MVRGIYRFNFGLRWDGRSHAFAFLSGPGDILRKARAARMVDLECDDRTHMPAAAPEVSRSEMALVTIDPKQLPPIRPDPLSKRSHRCPKLVALAPNAYDAAQES